MHRLLSASAALAGATLLQTSLLPTAAQAQAFDLVRVAQFITEPVAATAPPGDNDRLFVVGNNGYVHLIKNGSLLFTPFLDITSILQKVGEGGLLGMAFHPDYANNGYFYLSYTTGGPNGDSVISRFSVSSTNPDKADLESRVDIWGPLAQDQQIHRAGALHFGPDGMLYFSLGDGGPSGDTNNNAQDIDDPRGSILRFDVDAPFPHVPADNPFAGATPGDDHIWAYGLRNPYRFGIDSLTGDLYIGDVGQSSWEEIDYLPATAQAPLNFGWRCMEGSQCTGKPGCGCAEASWTPPVHEYDHSAAGGCAVIGGTVYRGAAIPSMQGRYLFTDFCTAKLYSFVINNGQAADLIDHTPGLSPPDGSSLGFPGGFGTDAQGEVYVFDYYGDEVFKLVPVDPWTDLGQATAGTLGAPTLTGNGALTPGNQVTVELNNALGNSIAALVIGFSAGSQPFFGGTLVPTPDSLILGVGTGNGTVTNTFNWPASFPHPELYLQYWVFDPAAPQGLSASNALKATQP
jgi:glucose/arabinose dehydrogenase